VIVGGNTSGSGRKEDVVLLEFSPDGDLLRSAVWGTAENESCVGMVQDEDGNLYLTGRYYVTWGDQSALILKLDREWNLVWAKTWGSDSRLERINTIAYANGMLALAGYVEMGDTDDALVLKLDDEGNLQWAKTWKLDMDEIFYSVAILPDGRIIAVGGSGIYSEEISMGILAVFNPDGSTLNRAIWQAGGQRLELRGACLLSNSSLAVTGNSDTGSFASTLDVDSFSIVPGLLWTAPVAGMSFLSSMQDLNGNLYVAGYNYSPITTGTKLPDESNLSTATGIDGIGDGILSEIPGTFTDPQGLVAMPEGIIDQESGTNEEAFIIKNPQY
jgi:hypothetical protein